MSARKPISAVLFVTTLLAAAAAHAQAVRKTPLDPNHPMVGSWRVEVPGTACFEVYDIHADSTMHVTSGAQEGTSEFEISAHPSEKGFYKWVDKITTDNGKPDCSGEVMKLGDVATNYVIFHPSKPEFLMCESEDIRSCMGPFRKVASGV